jgi:hypothetical protein
VQNSRINMDFFKKRNKSGGPSPRVVDRARVAGPRVHRGPHSHRRPELTLSWRHGRQNGGAGTLAVGSSWVERR